MTTLHENKHITNRYTLAEIKAQMKDGEYSAELLLHHLCLHANEMQRANDRLRTHLDHMRDLVGIGQKLRDNLRAADDDDGLAAAWDSLLLPAIGWSGKSELRGKRFLSVNQHTHT
jgi:hypothetical protein